MIRDYRVELSHFGGPLDLLLHLVRKQEVDIHDIPISLICNQYMEYMGTLEDLDLDDAGDFMVMAATLMVIKSRQLLPQEEVDLGEEIDPRYELVHQLLEYKKLKDSSQILLQRAGTFAQMLGRPESARPEAITKEDRSLDEIGIYDLLLAFSKVLESIGADAGKRERRIKIEDRPVREYVQSMRGVLQSRRSMLFSELMQEAGKERQDLIGFFLGLLLLLKQEIISCVQDGSFGDIRIYYRGETEGADVAIDLADDFR